MKIIKKLQYEILIFSYLLIQLFLKIPLPNKMHSWCTTPYALSYELGFNSRLLIGSFVHMLTDYITIEFLHKFIMIVLICLSLLISILIGIVIRKSNSQNKLIMILLAVLFIASPSSVSFLFYYGNFGRLDTFLLLFTLIAVLLIDKPYLKIGVPVLCFMCMATQQVFTFTYMPIILLLIVFDLVSNYKSKKQILFAIITFLTLAMSFAYFQFFAPVLNFSSPQSVTDFLMKKTNIPVLTEMIDFEYFKSIVDHWSKWVIVGWKERILKGLIILILTLPLSAIFITIWKNAIKNCTSKLQKFVLTLMLLAPIVSLPAFILTIDWGRWFAAVFITQFILIFYLSFKKYQPMLISLNKMQEFAIKNIFIFIILILYLSCLGTFNAAEPLDIAKTIIDFVRAI